MPSPEDFLNNFIRSRERNEIKQRPSQREPCVRRVEISYSRVVVLKRPRARFMSALHKQRRTRTHTSVFQQLIRVRSISLKPEIALELSAESAQARESLWYKLFVGRKLRFGRDGWPSAGWPGYIFFSLLVIPRPPELRAKNRPLICSQLEGGMPVFFDFYEGWRNYVARKNRQPPDLSPLRLSPHCGERIREIHDMIVTYDSIVDDMAQRE